MYTLWGVFFPEIEGSKLLQLPRYFEQQLSMSCDGTSDWTLSLYSGAAAR